MATFEISGISAAPGELKFGKMRAGQMRDGSIVTVPLMVMQGAHEGPKLWMDAAIHGDEISSIEVIRRIMREEVKPEDLSGTIVAAPVVNPFAFQAGSAGTPQQGGTSNADLHAIFPGNPTGTINDRLAHRVFNEGILKCDYYINFHGNFYPAVEFIPLTVCEDKEVLDASIAWAEAIGMPLSAVRGATGWPVYNAQKAGKPALVVELLAQGYMDQRSIDIGVLATLNALRHLKMVPGEVEPLPGLMVPPGRYGRGFVTSNSGGLVHFQKGAGDWLETGEVIAIIRDVYGDIVEEVKAPMQGYIRTILFGPHNEAVHEGSVIASILEAEANRDYFAD
ncbi:succinylglutamate desuccinylase/aspartoacylase family protein [Chloroflexota bacterium]